MGLGDAPGLDVVSTDGLVVNVNLPIRPGRILEMSSEEEIRAAVPGLIDMRMTMSVGDVVSSDLNSSSTPGVVFFRARNEAEIATTLSSLRRAYRLEVEPTERSTSTGRSSTYNETEAVSGPDSMLWVPRTRITVPACGAEGRGLTG